MSWKGFTKAVTRLPHLVLQKAGAVEESKDADFASLATTFERTAGATERLADDLKKYCEAVTALLTHHVSLLEVWQRVLGGDNEIVLSLLESVKLCKRRLLDDLDKSLNDQPLRILEELLMAQQGIAAKITKRNHKLIDYDRYRHGVKKLEADKSRTLSEERKLVKSEQAVLSAEQEYEKYNEQLKTDLPMFFSLHEKLLLPILYALVAFQQLFYRTQAETLHAIHQLDGAHDYVSILREFEETSAEALVHINEIPLIQAITGRVKRTDRTERADRNERGERGERDRTRTGSSVSLSSNSSASVKSPLAERKPAVAVQSPKEVPINPIRSSIQRPDLPIAKGASTKSASSDAKIFVELYQPTSSRGKEKFYDCKEPIKASMPTTSSSSSGGAPRTGRVAELAAKLGGMSLQTGPLTASKSIPQATTTQFKKQYAVAIYDFKGQEAEDLSFQTGDRIEVIKRTAESNDWWTGSLNGKKGVFPGTYVTLQ